MSNWRHGSHSYVVFADDLTGANDTGVQFTRVGLRTRVSFTWDQPQLLANTEVMVVDTDSRALIAAEAYRTVSAAAKAFAGMCVPILYKKIDSTLRGPIGAELDAVLDVYTLERAIVCPAYPAHGRTLFQGELRVGDIPVAQTNFAHDPVTPVQESHLPSLLQQQTKRPVHLVSLEQVTAGVHVLAQHVAALCASGGCVVVCDAVTDAQLAAIVDAALLLGEGTVLAGAAGLARPLAERISRRRVDSGCTRMLVVCGSAHPIVREQIAVMAGEYGAAVIALDAAAVIAGEVEWHSWIDLAVRHLGDPSDQTAIVLTGPLDVRLSGQERAVLACLADLAAAVMRSMHVGGIVATGGSTVRMLCERWQVSGIDLVCEMAPGIPLGRLSGGPHNGLPIITKAGAFGDASTLASAVAVLMKSLPKDTVL